MKNRRSQKIAGTETQTFSAMKFQLQFQSFAIILTVIAVILLVLEKTKQRNTKTALSLFNAPYYMRRM